ncbi:MAG: YdcF family protein [Clostridiales bacterium]|nr:YdcF family protein [Clostridiales bacterium]
MKVRFDTLDKKPKLFDVLIVFAITLAAVVILSATWGKRYTLVSALIVDAFLLYAIARLSVAFIGQLRYNPYSYNTIYYSGFALFLITVLIANVVLTVGMIKSPELYSNGAYLIHTLLGSARNYMLLSAPFILVFSIALCVSNISLIRHERFRFVNVLGIILAFLLIAGEVLLFTYDMYASGSQKEVMLHDLFVNLFAAVYLYFECMIIGAIIANIIVVKYEPDKDKDFLIILGCGLRKDGTPTPLLRGRCDRALAFYEKQKAETGKELFFVTSGGQGPGEANSESLAMKNYLLEKGIPEERVIEEDKSTDTLENMKFSKAKILERGENAKIVYATTNYHVFRSGLLARRVKMRAQGMGAKTKWYFWPNAAVREFVGLLTAHRLKQALILGGIIVFYVGLTLVAYLTVF